MSKPCFDGCPARVHDCSEGDPESNCRHLKAGGTWDDCDSALCSCNRYDFGLHEKLQVVEREREEETGRWQQTIYELCCKAVEGLREAITIDGAGCDSGDPLDLTLTEIGQAFNSLRDEIAELMREKAAVDQQIVKWRYLAEQRARERAVVESENVRLEGERAKSRIGIAQLRKERDEARAEVKELLVRSRTPLLDGDKP